MNPAFTGVVQAAVNRALALDPELAQVLAPIDGARLGVDIAAAVPLSVVITFARDSLTVVRVPAGTVSEAGRDADVVVRGTPSALFTLLTSGDELPAGSGVSVHGDIGLLQRVRSAASRLRPDWEEPIARALGDELGYPIARGLRHAALGVARAVRELHASTAEFLREESGWLGAAGEVEAFNGGVDDLRDAVDRLEQRIARVERSRNRQP